MTTSAGQEGGLWRPANATEGHDFEAKWCAHCLNSTPNIWEDEFGNEVVSGCEIVDASFWGHALTLDWIVHGGMPWCTAFRQDPERPARCLFTKEMDV